VAIIDEPVLVLNSAWQFTGFFPVQTALTNVIRGMALCMDANAKDGHYALYSFEEWTQLKPEGVRWIKTARDPIPAPDVVVLKHYGKRHQRKVSLNKINLARRDEHTCQYCGKAIGLQQVTIDHVLPRSRGGPLTWENCVAACAACNSRKADMTPKEARMPLRKKPHAPAFSPDTVRLPSGVARPAWGIFLQTG